MAPHSSSLAWKIPWTEEPGRLQSMGSLRVRRDWVTSLSLFTFMHWRRKWQPTPVFLPGEFQGQGSLVGCRRGVAQSRTWLKRLSSSSSGQLLRRCILPLSFPEADTFSERWQTIVPDIKNFQAELALIILIKLPHFRLNLPEAIDLEAKLGLEHHPTHRCQLLRGVCALYSSAA